MPTVSIIITCANQAAYLPDAIDCCLRQTYRDYEMIVVDDGSQDMTRAICQQFPQIHYYYQPPTGLAAARNTGWKMARGSFIQFLDADNFMLRRKLERCLDTFQQYPESDIVYTGHEVRSPNLRDPYPELDWPFVSAEQITLPGLVNSVRTFWPVHAPLIRRSCVERIDGWADHIKLMEDWYLWIALLVNGAKYRSINEPLAWYRARLAKNPRRQLEMATFRLTVHEELRHLTLPEGVINLDQRLAERHHLVAARYWQTGNRKQARQHFREAMKLESKGRRARRYYIILSYFSGFNLAQKLLHWVRPSKPASGNNPKPPQSDPSS